jgi:oligopeptide transport system substrate-binding protein
LLLALAIPILAGCSRSGRNGVESRQADNETPKHTPSGATVSKQVLRIQQASFPIILDPQKSVRTNEGSILGLNYEGLTRLDKDLKTVPAAAESWDFDQAQTQITFHLRAGLAYSDGSPLSAVNFRYAIERACDPNTAGGYQAILFDITGCDITGCQAFAKTNPTDSAAFAAPRAALGVKAPDARTLVIQLTHPAPYFVTIASLPVFFPAQEALIKKGGEGWWKDPADQVGNGPFKITRIDPDQRITLAANDHYWAGKPKLASIELITQAQSSVALEAYQAGQLDIIQVDPSQLPAIKDNQALANQLVTFPAAETYGMDLNLNLAPFQDRKIREAFSEVFDRKTYCDQLRSGTCSPALSWIPPGVAGAIQTDKYGFNPAGAKQAIADSSYGSPDKVPEVKVSFASNDPAAQPRAAWLAGQLQEILGIKITLDPIDGKTLQAMTAANATHPQLAIYGGWSEDYPDPENWLSINWKCDTAFAQARGYCNHQFDQIIDQADRETDPAKRISLYQQAGQILVDDVPGPFAYYPVRTFLVKPSVTGYSTTPEDSEWPGQTAAAQTFQVGR